MTDRPWIPGKRELLAKVLHRTGLLDVIAWVRSHSQPRTLTALTYHRIDDLPSDRPFCDSVIDASPEEFRRHLALFRRWSTVVGMEAVRTATSGGTLPPAPLLLTFDDGYRSCAEVALPLLQEFGLHAVFFVPTAFIEERRIGWWDQISYLVKTTNRSAIRLTYPRTIELELGDREEAIADLNRLVVNDRQLDMDRFLPGLVAACDVRWSRPLERDLADEQVMTWQDVRALRAAGMDVQSHTRRHPVLPWLDATRWDDELAGSRADLEHRLGERIDAIAYPSGHPIRGCAGLREAVADAGYEFGFTFGGGVNRLNDLDPFEIRRLSVNRQLSYSMFRMQVVLPALAYATRRYREEVRGGA